MIVPTIVSFEPIEEEFFKEKKRLEDVIKNVNKILETYPGKDLIKMLNGWSTSNYRTNITFDDLLEHISVDEIDKDFELLVNKIVSNCNSEVHRYLDEYQEIDNKYVRFETRRSIVDKNSDVVMTTHEEKILLSANLSADRYSYNMDRDIIGICDYLFRKIHELDLNESKNKIRTGVRYAI